MKTHRWTGFGVGFALVAAAANAQLVPHNLPGPQDRPGEQLPEPSALALSAAVAARIVEIRPVAAVDDDPEAALIVAGSPGRISAVAPAPVDADLTGAESTAERDLMGFGKSPVGRGGVQVLAANGPTTTVVHLNEVITGGTIPAGTLKVEALSVSLPHSTPRLDGVTVLADVEIGLVGGVAHLEVTNGTVFAGNTIGIGFAGSVLRWNQSAALNGQQIQILPGSGISINGSNSLTLGPTTTVTGTVRISGGLAGSVLLNQGTITHHTSFGGFGAQTTTNAGLITSYDSAMTLGKSIAGSTFENTSTGTIRLTGPGTTTVELPGTTQLMNRGLIDVQTGTFAGANHLTNAPGGTIRGAGTISGDVVFEGGTLAPGNSIGTLTINAGRLLVTQASVFAVELGGASADQLQFTNPTGVVDLGSGLLTLSLTLLSAPSNFTNYDIIQIGSGGSGITGTFAGLPNTGDLLTADFGGATYPFTITYQANSVTLNFTTIPEPSTWAALVGFTALAFAWVVRRRQRR